jgi:hypothetical protein
VARPTDAREAGGSHYWWTVGSQRNARLGHHRGHSDAVTELNSGVDKQPALPASLAEYADRLLLSTGLQVEEAMLIACGQLEPPPELEGLSRALRTGWSAADSA